MRPKTLLKPLLSEVIAFIWCPWSRQFVCITVGRLGTRDRKCGHRARSDDCKDGEVSFNVGVDEVLRSLTRYGDSSFATGDTDALNLKFLCLGVVENRFNLKEVWNAGV